MVRKHGSFDEFLQDIVNVEECDMQVKTTTYGHRELVVREHSRHQRKEIFIILVQSYRQQCESSQRRFERGREFTLRLP